jgi:hypothetical protein
MEEGTKAVEQRLIYELHSQVKFLINVGAGQE